MDLTTPIERKIDYHVLCVRRQSHTTHEFNKIHWLLFVVAAKGHIILLCKKCKALYRDGLSVTSKPKTITFILWIVEHSVMCAGDSVGGVQLMKMVGCHDTFYF